MPSYYINLIGVIIISLFVSYWPPPMTRNAVSATIVAGGRAQFQENIEVNRNKLMSILIYGIKQNPSMAATEKVCARSPTPQAAWVHQIHAAGGLAASPPW
jgi:hypothetical protein